MSLENADLKIRTLLKIENIVHILHPFSFTMIISLSSSRKTTDRNFSFFFNLLIFQTTIMVIFLRTFFSFLFLEHFFSESVLIVSGNLF